MNLYKIIKNKFIIKKLNFKQGYFKRIFFNYNIHLLKRGL
jgi:hypothetical protein